MPSTLDPRLSAVQRKMLAIKGEGVGEGRRKRLAGRRTIGKIIERALQIANVTKQDAAHAMGYADQSALARWISGVEPPQLDKLRHEVPRFSGAFIVAQAEDEESGVAIETVMTLSWRVAS